MAIHDDIAASLPDPPPPAPARRAAAIEQALRRFDGAAQHAAPAPSDRPQSKPWLSPSGRRYAGALASIALVALIGAPLAWQTLRESPAPERDEPIAATVAEAPGEPPATALDARGAAVASRRAPPPVIRMEPSGKAEAADTASAADRVVFAEAVPRVPPAAARAAPALSAPGPGRPASRDAAPDEAIMVSGSRIATLPAPPSADTLAVESTAIAVTGSRVGAMRGDWNECTVDDPGRSLAGCRHLIDPAAKGVGGRAAAHLADGLTLAWRGELDAAITAFDRAIEIAPRSSIAYLNRGLAHRRNGDTDRALTDLDRAVRNAPRSARAYYNRSLVLRQQGADSRAEADEKRAVTLDPRYLAVVQ
jgi:tetratricopeptide (TPR) repeat protein